MQIPRLILISTRLCILLLLNKLFHIIPMLPCRCWYRAENSIVMFFKHRKIKFYTVWYSVNNYHLRDNCIQIFICSSISSDIWSWTRQYTSPTHTNALLQLILKLEYCKGNIINDVKTISDSRWQIFWCYPTRYHVTKASALECIVMIINSLHAG